MNQLFQKYQLFPLGNESLHSAILNNQSPLIGLKSEHVVLFAELCSAVTIESGSCIHKINQINADFNYYTY